MPSLASHHPRRRALLAGLPAACLAGPAWAQGMARAPGDVLIGGTGAGLGPLQKVMPPDSGARFVPSLGTGGGLKALAAGAIDIALAARRLTDAERAQGLVERELFRTPLVWAVNAGVGLARTTLRELQELYSGRTPHWPNGQPVRLVLRPETDSDTRALKALGADFSAALALAHSRPGVHMAISDGEALESIERIVGALGITQLGLMKAEGRKVRELPLDGVAPSLDTLASGQYRLAKTVTLVTRAAPGAATARAVEWLSGKAAAQALAALACLTPQAA